MKILHSTLISLVLLFFFTGSSFSTVQAQSDEVTIQTVIHLLGYVALDYPEAVEDGVIIDEQEYEEQVEFSEQAYVMTEEGDFLAGEQKASMLSQMMDLRKLIENKASAEEIHELASNINLQIIKITGVVTSPRIWPDLDYGRELYMATCATCHGDQGHGDGPGGEGLEPEPSDFHDDDLMDNFSPYQAYNSIKLGIPGTAMIAYTQYSESEIWDLAFYVESLKFGPDAEESEELRAAFREAYGLIDLQTVANLTNNQLQDSLGKVSDNAEAMLRALRTLQPVGENAVSSLTIAEDGLNAALASYIAGERKLARTQAINAYLEGIEPVEARLRARDAAFVIQIEEQMFKVRQAIEKDLGIEVLEEETAKALSLISQADDMTKDHKLNYWLTFLIAGTIFLREGIEAFLIIAVILALIRRAGATKALAWLHGGWITAVVMGVVGWFLSDYIIQFGGRNRELMEGIVALLAVAILLYVGFWLHSKTEAKEWTRFIRDRIGGLLERDKMFGLAAFAFMVVFREAFEVILFLQAVSLEADASNQSAIGLGVLAATVLIILIAVAFLKYSKMIPVRKLFLYSSFVIVLLAIMLMGKGIHALQECGYIAVTSLPTYLRAEWLGIYPTVQTIGAQVALIILIIFIYFFQQRRGRAELEHA